MKLAKVRHRVIATIVDNLIIFAIIAILFFSLWAELIYGLNKGVAIDPFMIMKLLRTGIIYALILLFYYTVIPIFSKGQTIGKKIFKIKVVTNEGKDVDYKVLFFREAICRILVRTVSLGISSLVSYLVILIRDDRKSLADVFSKTKVIDIKEEV